MSAGAARSVAPMPRESPDRCAPAAQRRGDSRVGTAARADRFLLLERPGPWPARAALDVVDPAVREHLAAATAALSARLVLIRRVGRAQAGGSRRWYLADARPGHQAVRWGELPEEKAIADLDLAAGRDDLTAVGEEWSRPLFLVCTHGRHDVCCAVRGRPLAAALHDLRPADTWECSHLGGHRFAANLLTLPLGLYHGGVTEADLPDLVALTDRGRGRLDLLRGRSAWPAAAQAAAWFWWRERGEATPDPNGVVVMSVDGDRDGRSVVRLGHDDGVARVTVISTRDPEAHRLSCSALQPEHAQRWELVGITAE